MLAARRCGARSSWPPPALAPPRSQGLLEILAAASEFDDVPVRPGEERVVQKLLQHAPLAVDKPRYADPHTKVNALVQVGAPGWGRGAAAAAAAGCGQAAKR